MGLLVLMVMLVMLLLLLLCLRLTGSCVLFALLLSGCSGGLIDRL